jgi:hypothetical protein
MNLANIPLYNKKTQAQNPLPHKENFLSHPEKNKKNNLCRLQAKVPEKKRLSHKTELLSTYY